MRGCSVYKQVFAWDENDKEAAQRVYSLNSKLIYKIPGAGEVATDIVSYSKYVGFTGIRFGWLVVLTELWLSDGFPFANIQLYYVHLS